MAGIGAFALVSESTVKPVVISSTVGLQTTPGSLQNLINQAVPVNETYRVRKVLVACRGYARFDVSLDGIIVGSGRTSAAESNVVIGFAPFIEVAATKILLVTLTQSTGPALDVEAYLYITKV